MSDEDRFWQLAIAVNAAFKGLLGSMGESGNICARAIPVPVELRPSDGWPAVQHVIAESLREIAQDGDVVVVADAIVAASLGRIGPGRILHDPDPKTVAPSMLADLAARWSTELGMTVEPWHLLLADEYPDGLATIGSDLPNERAAELSEEVRRITGCATDAIVSDTDTGLDTRTPLIGTVTIAATPLGATAGINLYEAMRCAVAAEFVRGHRRRIPVVVCRPAERRRHRELIGALRYSGHLDAAREPSIAYA